MCKNCTHSNENFNTERGEVDMESHPQPRSSFNSYLLEKGTAVLFSGKSPHSRVGLMPSCSTCATQAIHLKHQIIHWLLMAGRGLGCIRKKLIICIITRMRFFKEIEQLLFLKYSFQFVYFGEYNSCFLFDSVVSLAFHWLLFLLVAQTRAFAQTWARACAPLLFLPSCFLFPFHLCWQSFSTKSNDNVLCFSFHFLSFSFSFPNVLISAKCPNSLRKYYFPTPHSKIH